MLAIIKIGFLVAARKTCKPRVFRYMDILAFQITMLEVLNIGGVMKSMSVCKQNMYANANLD